MGSESARSPVHQTLIVAPSWVGDIVMSQVTFRRLKRLDPNVAIDVLAPPWAMPLINRMEEVRAVLPSPLRHGEIDVSAMIRCARELRNRAYDRALVLPRSLKSALIPWLARIPKRVGHLGEMRYGFINDRRMHPPDKRSLMVNAYLDLVDGSPVAEEDWPKLRVDSIRVQTLIDELGLSSGIQVAALMPGAEFGPSKMWPLEYFRNLAGDLRDKGFEIWIFGSEKDRVIGDRISEGLGKRVWNLCGRTGLEDVVDLLSVASISITNDSGLMHIAAAVGCPVISLFGATTPAYTPPLTRHRHIFFRGIECSPCFERQCRFGHYACLKEIGPGEVLKVAGSLSRQGVDDA